MSGATVPLWVTIMLGAMTVVGTVAGAWGGQWIATRRDDRRWDREVSREDLRWNRERERVEAQRLHEVQLHWREERQVACSAYLSRFDTWHARMQQEGDNFDNLTYWTLERRAEVHALLDRFIESWSALQFVVSGRVLSKAALLFVATMAIESVLESSILRHRMKLTHGQTARLAEVTLRYASTLDADDPEAESLRQIAASATESAEYQSSVISGSLEPSAAADLRSRLADILTARSEFIAEVRRELGVQDAAAVTPTQPSDLTS